LLDRDKSNFKAGTDAGATDAEVEVLGSFRENGRGTVEPGGNSEGAGGATAGSRVSSRSALPESMRRGSLFLRDPSVLLLPLLLPESASNDKTRGAKSASNALSCGAVVPK
jgi:hypothetical protein